MIKNGILIRIIIITHLYLVSFASYSSEWSFVRDVKDGKIYVDIENAYLSEDIIVVPTINNYTIVKKIFFKEYLSIKYLSAYDCPKKKLSHYNYKSEWFADNFAKGEVINTESNPKHKWRLYKADKPHHVKRLNVVCELLSNSKNTEIREASSKSKIWGSLREIWSRLFDK